MAAATTKAPAATGAFETASRCNGSSTNASKRGHNMNTRQSTVTVRSATGTAPITFARLVDGAVRIDLQDGSSQVYDAGNILTAALAMVAPRGWGHIVGEALLHLADDLGIKGSALLPGDHITGHIERTEVSAR
jgi:hypothetical protein